jgi:ankyrin repeat protein
MDTDLISNARRGNLGGVRDLLQAGANVNAKDSNGDTALHCASVYGRVEVVRELLQHNKVDVNLRRIYDGSTVLLIASQNGHLEIVRELLQNNKVDVNRQRTYDGATALCIASENGHVDVVRQLLQHDKVDVNLQRQDGATVLYVASQLGRVEVVRELLDHSEIDVNVQYKDGTTALDVAKHNKQYGVVNVFPRHQKALEAADQDRKSLAKVMNTISADPVELSYQYIKDCITDQKLGSGPFGDVFLAEDSELPEPKKFAVKMIKISRSSDDKTLKTFQKELSVRSLFCIECCIVWSNAPCTSLPRVLTNMRNSGSYSNDFVIPISLYFTATISKAVLRSSFWCMNMQPTARLPASSGTTAIEPACLPIFGCRSCLNWREQ